MSEERLDRIQSYRRSQPIEELKRKAKKSVRNRQKMYTAEELDWAHAEGLRMSKKLQECKQGE